MPNFKENLKLNLFVLIALITALIIPVFAQNSEYELVIKNGTVINPSTEHKLVNYNLGINDGTIKRITTANIEGEEVIDASGLYVVPGFIDLISYEPNPVGTPLKIKDGVTSNLLMHGGTEDATRWYRVWEERGLPFNFGASSFVTRMRWPYAGYQINATITDENKLEQLATDVRENIEAGALGVSFSPEYVPGIKEDEIVSLLDVAADVNAPTFFHTRYSSVEPPGIGPDGVEEVIDYAHQTGAAVHIMHINSTGGTQYMGEALEMIHQARNEGLDITACTYPYNAWATYLSSARFEPGWQDRFNITYEDLQITGTEERITQETFEQYREEGKLVYAHDSMPEEEIVMAIKDPVVMLGSDTMIQHGFNNHPRGAGAFTRLFRKYVREEEVISTMQAVKMTSYQPAKRLESIAPAMEFKGRIEIGADADLTIYNPQEITDQSTPANPGKAAQGVEYVLVNGELVKNRDGLIDDVNPGQAIRSYFVDEREGFSYVNQDIKLNEQVIIEEIKVYSIDDKQYLPANILSELELDIQEKRNGSFIIKPSSTASFIRSSRDINFATRSTEFAIGQIQADRNGQTFNLSDEAIISRGEVYLSLDTIADLLTDCYSLENKAGSINFLSNY